MNASAAVRKPDGTAALNPAAVKFTQPGTDGNVVVPSPNYVYSNGFGNAVSTMRWADVGSDFAPRNATIVAQVLTDYELKYSPVGSLISGYSLFPGITTIGIYARSSVSVYTTHVNPIAGGPDMLPLYRVSWRCGDAPSGRCDSSSDPNYNPNHISHRYTTDWNEVDQLVDGSGYKFDGIEGYVFPKSYTNAPIAGAVRLCRLYDPKRDELILFPGTGSNGKTCNPPFPSYATGSYYSDQLAGTDWLGWVTANYAGNTPPTVSLSSPANNATFSLGSTVTLTASASDSNGIANVKFYANGVQVASDGSSPYNKTWTPSTAGTYVIHAVATDNNSASLQTTSNPRQITVGSCANTIPTVGNAGFETPVLAFGTYDDAPAGASWSFVPAWAGGQSGVSANGSPFTDRNPNAPAGAQVGYIQGANTISQTINFPSCGTYRVRISAAQRDPFYNQSSLGLELYVDGVKVGTTELTPPDRTYTTRTSAQFNAAAGNRTITFQGVNNGFDNSLFLDSVQIISP